MTTMLCRNLFDMNPFHSHNKLVRLPFHAHNQFAQLSFHSRTAFSGLAITRAHEESLFSNFATTKFNMSEADITRMLRLAPQLEDLETLDNVEQFIHVFKKRGYTDDQIAMIMRKQPFILSASVNNLESKLRLLEDSGFEGQTLAELMTASSGILSLSLEEGLIPSMMFLKSIFVSEELVKALLIEPQLLCWDPEKVLRPSLAFWERYGFSREELSSLLSVYPRLLLRKSLKPGEADFIREIGLDKGSSEFKYMLLTVSLINMKTLKARIENLKSWGLSAQKIWQIFRVAPEVLRLPKELIGEKMNFLVNHLEVPAKSVVEHPIFLLNDLERTTRPRFLFWQKIESTAGLNFSVLEVLSMTERRFIEVIEGHPDSETLRTIYENAVSDAPSGAVTQSDQAD